MKDTSAEITEILSVETVQSPSLAPPTAGSLLIRWRSGRRAEEVCIQHDVALTLAAAIELESNRSSAFHGAASHDIAMSAGSLP
jgi:hypothetical protein